MKPKTVHRLPAPLETAAQTLKLAARTAVERTIESLGLAALAAGSAFQRDGLLGAQFELNRKSAVFVLSFNDVFDERVLREAGGMPAPAAANGGTAWDELSLVANHEVEVQISAERFGMDVAHACEWELREFDAYVASLLDYSGSEKDRNPLRPQVIGHAMVRAIESVSERADVRKLLSSEISRSLGSLLRKAYADIVADLRSAGVQPRGLSVRTTAQPRSGDGFDTSSRASGFDDPRSVYSRSGVSQQGSVYGQDALTGVRRPGGTSSHSNYGGFAASARGNFGGRGPSLGAVDPALMNLIRRLTHASGFLGDNGAAGGRGGGGGQGGSQGGNQGGSQGGHFGASANWSDLGDFDDRRAAVPNLIVAHREELRRASRGSLDHMVIDVIAGLFDQILSDPKLPPQMARLIARLQLPVLRAALGDTSFFSSRRHPVRRFINRIASLGSAFEDYSEPAAQRFLAKVKTLINEVVDGEFDQIETYEAKLQALEAFMAESSPSDGAAAGQAAELLSQKEDELRLRQLYAQRLEGELKGLAGPDFVRDFITRVWSQVMVRAAALAGADSELVQQLRRAGRELFMSVQPKATPAARKVFLAELPRLMQDLTEGMNLIAWPDTERRGFFGQLMPAHAEALKNTGARQLDINLLARQVEGALDKALPSAEELKAALPGLPVLNDEVHVPAFTPEEARRVGLVQDAAVDWSAPATPPAAGEIDIDIEIEPTPPGASAQARMPGDPVPGSTAKAFATAEASDRADAADAAEPTRGRALADHVQIGFAYQMQLDGQWQKVRLSHVSPARSFFVFTHGTERAQQTVSLSRRMLEKLCEAGRMRAFEQAFLVERATARARRQLAAMA